MSDPKPDLTPEDGSGDEIKVTTAEGRRLKGSKILRDRGKDGAWSRYIVAIKLGMTKGHAAEFAGIGEATVRVWKTNAIDDEAADKRTVFVKFFEAVGAARASMLSRNLATVEKARQTGDLKAATWLLERHGYHRKTEIEGEIATTLTYVVDNQDLEA